MRTKPCKNEVFIIPENLKEEDIINVFVNQFDNICKVVCNDEIICKQKSFGFYYNSFTPTIVIKIESNKLYVTYKLTPSVKLLMYIFNLIALAFLLMFIALAITSEINWLFSLIPLGMAIFMYLVYKVCFTLEVRRISLLIAKCIK